MVLGLENGTLPTDQLFLEFQFESTFNLDFQPKFGILLGNPIPMGINLGECEGGAGSLGSHIHYVWWNKFSYMALNFFLDLEREMQEGILHAEDPHNTCLTFLRTIVDLKNYVTHPMAPNFMEVIINLIRNVSLEHIGMTG